MGTPVKFLELTIRNFMSYGNNDTVIELDFNQPTLIVGRNLDAIVNGQVDSNGAGKSAILDALAFALYGKTISTKELSDLINVINKKNMEVALTFAKNGRTYKVVRSKKSKSKSDIGFYHLGEDGEWVDKTLDSIANNNKEIVRITGLPFDIFSRIIVFSASFQPFLDLPGRHASKTSQTSIIEELFGFTELSEKAESLKKLIKVTKADFEHIKEIQVQVSLEMKRHDAQLTSAKTRADDWETTQAKDIQSRKNAIKTLSTIDFDEERSHLERLTQCESDITSEKLELQTYESKLSHINQTKTTSLVQVEALSKAREKVKMIEDAIDFKIELKHIDEIESLRLQIGYQDDAIKSHGTVVKSTQREIDKLESQIAHINDDKCPFCEQTFEDSDAKLKEITDEVSILKEKLDEATESSTVAAQASKDLAEGINNLILESMFDGKKSDYDQVLDNYKTNKAKLDAVVDPVNIEELDKEASSITEAITHIKSKIGELETEITSIKATAIFNNIGELEREAAKVDSAKLSLGELENTTNPHLEALADLEGIEFNNDRSSDLNALDESLRHQEFLLKLLTKKDSFIRKNLLDRSLPYLNKRLMVYLEQLGLPHRVEFLTDMSAQISQFGTPLSFGSLSSGQRARVNLALAFAFRDVLQARYGKISFCMLDECLDTGLGNVGVQLAAKMIKAIATENKMSMFVISHRDEIANMFPNKLIVQLKNGFSTIISE